MGRILAACLMALCLAVPLASSRHATAHGGSTFSDPTAKTPPTSTTGPFQVGERLTYDVSWSNFLTAGEATLTVKERRASVPSPSYFIVAEGRTIGLVARLYTLYYKADTLLDATSLLPIRGSVFSQEGRRKRNKMTMFDRKAGRVAYEMHTATVSTKEFAAPKDVYDVVSALYVLRTLPLGPGSRHTMTVCDNARLYRLVAHVEARETVKTGIGSRQALRIRPAIFNEKGEPQGRGFLLWLSEDAARMPLKMTAELQVGSINLVLRQAVRPDHK